MRYACGRIDRNCAAPIMPSVCGVSGTCSVTTSLSRSSVSRSASFAPNASARAAPTYGSCASTFIPNAAARVATFPPIRPSPTMPSVFPNSSVPISRLRSQTPSRSCCTADGVRRASESISANVCSVAAIVFAPGVFSTRIPASVAASTSIESTPAPARATTARRGPAASSSRSTRVSERTISPSASASSAISSARVRPIRASTSIPASRSTATPASANGSAIRTRLRPAALRSIAAISRPG
jgi:hypothetical protein